jgi:hypothetical protein
MSSYNPFRTQLATPNPTGASASSTVPPSYTSAAPPSFSAPPSYSNDDDDEGEEESPEALPELTPRIPSGRSSQLTVQNTGSSLSTPPSLPPRPSSSNSGPPLPPNRPQTDDLLSSTDGISESAPPAYSVTPDVGGGELVVEQGPRRPFQRAPEPLLQLSTPPNQQQQQGQQQPPRAQPPQFAPPAGLPTTRPRPNSQLSDFAQDFYNSTPAVQQQSQQPRYAPPPGPPPPRRPRAASTSSGAGSTAPPASDGRPTTTPTPGHPLLRNGKTLVYPESYLCQKCTFSTLYPPYCFTQFFFTAPKRKKARIRATRTMTRLTHVASAGIVLASHIRPLSLRARGVVTRPAGQRARASVAAHSSARCPHSSLRKHKRNPGRRRQCLAAVPHPRGC